MSNRILTPFEVDSDSDNIVELEVKADKELYLKNSQVQANTAAVDSVLSLSNASTGKLQYRGINESYVYKSALAPMTPKPYELWFNTSDNSLNFWDGLAWVNISANSASNKAYVEATINPAGQSLAPIGSSIKINWNNIISDVQSCFDPFTDEFVAPRNGKYLVLAMLRTEQTSNGIGNLSAFSQIWKNGSSYLESGAFSQYSGSTGLLLGARLVSSTVIELLASDKIDFRVFLPAYWTIPATISGISTLHRLTIIEL